MRPSDSCTLLFSLLASLSCQSCGGEESGSVQTGGNGAAGSGVGGGVASGGTNGTGASSGNGGTTAGSGGGGGSIEARCLELGLTCGQVRNRDNETLLDCGRCRFEWQGFPQAERLAMAMTPAGPTLAYYTPNQLVILRSRPEGFVNTLVELGTAPIGDLDAPPDLAVDANGTLWIAYVDDGGQNPVVQVGQLVGDTFTSEIVDQWGEAPVLALGASGAVHVAYLQRETVWYAQRATSGWNKVSVEYASALTQSIAISVSESETAHLLYANDDARTVRHAWGGLDGFSFASVAENVSIGESKGAVALAFDKHGQLHATWGTLEKGLSYNIRSVEGVWQERLSFADGYGALAFDAQSRVHLAIHGNNLFTYQVPVGEDAVASRNILGDSTDPEPADLAFDGQAVLHFAAGRELIKLMGRYSEEYERACERLDQAYCQKLASCGRDADGHFCVTYGVNSNCFANCKVRAHFCGDSFKPEQPLFDCEATLGQEKCTGTPGVDASLELPPACIPAYGEELR